MALSRYWMKRLENSAKGDLEWFRLKSGQRFFYDPGEVGKELFLHGCNRIRDPYTGEDHGLPEILRTIVEDAADPREVLGRFVSGDPAGMFFDPLALLED
jgi:hypothetical protein